MNENIDKALSKIPPECPICGAVMEHFFHERDSTSNSMHCKNAAGGLEQTGMENGIAAKQ